MDGRTPYARWLLNIGIIAVIVALIAAGAVFTVHRSPHFQTESHVVVPAGPLHG